MARPEEADPSAHEGGARALLAAVAAGDATALRRFYELCVDGLYSFVFYRVGKDPALAEDVVQETFIAAMERNRDFDAERGTLRSWLCQLSRNVIRTHLRERRRLEEIDMWDRADRALLEALERMEREALAHEVLEKEEVRDLVHTAMVHLADHHRQILQRKYVDERTLAELAEELGVTEEAAKSSLARARRAFRETFQALGRALAEVES